MNKITAIRKQEKRSGRVNIFVNGSFFIGLKEPLLIDLGLFVGKELTDAELLKIKASEHYQKTLDRAFRLLTYRPRSESEMRTRLKEKAESQEIEKVISYLKDISYLDDSDFAKRWVEERAQKRGTRLLRLELFKKGISEEIINTALSGIGKENEVECGLRLVEKKKAYLALAEPERKQKITAFLARRGFSYDVIKEIIPKLNC